MGTESYLLYTAIVLVAFLYSSVGHGGASGYLALMALFSIPAATMKPVALQLNLVVSLISFIQFYRSGFFDRRIFLLLAVTSIPAAFAGGWISIDTAYYKQLLGVFLFFASARLLMSQEKETIVKQTPPVYWLLVLGAGIGFFSGMIGIGGGIILSPFLILLGYASVKTTAGISALFIFVNSFAGLLGHSTKQLSWSPSMLLMIVLAVFGGIAGSQLGAKKFNTPLMKKVLSLVLILAAMKLVFV